MRPVPRALAVLSLPYRALVAAYDERNIRRLARRYGCSVGDARELYRLARHDGFGAAHEAVFGPGRPIAERPATADVTVDVTIDDLEITESGPV